MKKLAVLDDYEELASQLGDWERLSSEIRVDFYSDHLAHESAVAERLKSYDILVIMRERTPFSRSLIEKLPNLKLLVTTGGRNRAIDLAACKEKGIIVCGTQSGKHPAAEHAWALILSLVKRIPHSDRATRSGRWGGGINGELFGKRLGVLGLGNLGARVAAVGQAFGMEVFAWSQNLTADRAAEVGVLRVEKDELFERSDILTIHLVLSERTRGIVGAREISRMKRASFLVNTSRGPIVDEHALVDALRKNRIAGAGLDVFDIEPLPAGHPFLTLPNTVVTPHMGYVTEGNFNLYFKQAVEDVAAWLDGSPIRTL
ncbi:MAG: D-2-hydroxyacid dehydrogenase family protein [Desulfobacteraceae bacterium]|nr:MAG: D-2-hydroxyacid dehydrogenase family protein [Desulfobacteraceae bacterium]